MGRVNEKKFIIAFVASFAVGIMAIFMFLLLLAQRYVGAGEQVLELFDRTFYVLFGLLIVVSVALSIAYSLEEREER